MRQFSLFDQISGLAGASQLPAPYNLDQAERGLNDWRAAVRDSSLDDLADAADHPVGQRLLSALFGNSPFLGNCLLRDIAFSERLFSQTPDRTLEQILDDLTFAGQRSTPVPGIMKLLRQRKHQVALLTAVADISGLWSLDQVTGALSAFAECALNLTVSRLLADQAEAGNLLLPRPSGTAHDDPATGSGFTVLGMGKLGARELNYSSDIDLIVLYDEERMRYTGRRSLGECLVRLTRDLVRILQTRTADGYVFRTDLRLRPDPRATPVALSMAAAELYYESVGLNWERAAMIKARPVAGDLDAGADFLQRISPFVWRKNLDYTAVQDIHAIKHQIHSHHGHGAITVAGHDVKLGRGGIREIEFSAQAHQLLLGGREPGLRDRRTCDTLKMLAELNKMEVVAAEELIEAYGFLRRLEHRLQMVNDEQTHTLPEQPEGIAAIACFMGHDSAGAFSAQLLEQLETVQRHYEKIFDDGALPGDGALTQAAIASDASSESLAALQALGYEQARSALKTVQGWGEAPYRAMRYERAQTLLADLIPPILTALGNTAEPDRALIRFDEFLRGLPEGVQLFSLLHANSWLLDLLAEIMGSAPRLAALLGHRAGLLDAVLDLGFYEPLPGADVLEADLERALDRARDYQDILDFTRSWSNEHRFQVGVQVLRGTITPEQAGYTQSDLADVVIRALLPRVEAEFSRHHGKLGSAEMSVLALGKLGGRELTFTSDLDLVFLYDVGASEQSDGERPLPAATYFARLSQRFINALTALTSEGRLYEIDMRLRPSGRAGPIAQSIDSFANYQKREAWTWEHMALTRARVISASPGFTEKIETIIQSVLTAPRDLKKLVVDVAGMREKLRREFGGDSIWRVKHAPGGLLDVEFITQYLQLAAACNDPGVLHQNTQDALHRLLSGGHIQDQRAEHLLDGLHLFTAVQSLLRLCTEESFDEKSAPLGLKIALAASSGNGDFDALKQRLRHAEATVYRCFKDLIDQPAETNTGSQHKGEHESDG